MEAIKDWAVQELSRMMSELGGFLELEDIKQLVS